MINFQEERLKQEEEERQRKAEAAALKKKQEEEARKKKQQEKLQSKRKVFVSQVQYVVNFDGGVFLNQAGRLIDFFNKNSIYRKLKSNEKQQENKS